MKCIFSSSCVQCTARLLGSDPQWNVRPENVVLPRKVVWCRAFVSLLQDIYFQGWNERLSIVIRFRNESCSSFSVEMKILHNKPFNHLPGLRPTLLSTLPLYSLYYYSLSLTLLQQRQGTHCLLCLCQQIRSLPRFAQYNLNNGVCCFIIKIRIRNVAKRGF